MSGRYRYVTVLKALNDGEPPNDNIKEGDEIVKPGKHTDDEITYLKEDNGIGVIRFEQSELLDAGEARFSESVIMDWAEGQLFGDP